MRRFPLSLFPAAVLVLTGLAPVRSADVPREKPAPGPEVKELTREGRNAVEKGLAYLARQQVKAGPGAGSWIANVGYKVNLDYRVTRRGVGHPGITALAGMAFLAGGNTPGRGRYGKNVAAAVRYILSCVNSDGMITKYRSRMYSHAFGTLFLAEVYGMTRDARVRAALERATEFTWKCQNRAGGWRYAPYAQDSDMSITVCQVMALRAARNIGIKVPRASIERAVDYVLMSAITRGDQQGGFKYQYREAQPIATRASFALTAAGLTTLYSAGLYSNRDIMEHIRRRRLTKYLRGIEPPPKIEDMLRYIETRYGTTPREHFFFFYGNYYAVQAMFIAGGRWWERYFRRVQNDLVSSQLEDGSWNVAQVGNNFSTAAACLILQIPYRYLPIFQR